MFDPDQLASAGISGSAWLDAADIPFSDEFRAYCENDMCGKYNTSWACPPAVGTVEACRARCLQFERAMVFCTIYPREDSFDFEAMAAGHRDFKNVCDRLYALIPEGTPHLLLSNEGCFRCAKCTWPEAPCRFPDKLFPSVEGFGVDVMALCRKTGLKYYNGEQAVTYFGVLLV